LGFVQNVPEVLASSDLMILPSFHEGLSYACMEAQASGTVVVANDISGIRCVVEDGITGYLVPGNEIGKYLEIIRGIDLNRSSIEDIRLSAKKRVRQFSREDFMPHYIAYLKSLHGEKNHIAVR
jgi:glycosyltransferase involved in cell wall biosynthesis